MTWFIKRLHADLETPVSAYLKLRQDITESFLFESVEGNEVWASYSILGIGSRCSFSWREGVLTQRDLNGATTSYDAADPLDGLREAQAKQGMEICHEGPAFVGGLFGFLAYDAVRAFELLPLRKNTTGVPDLLFIEPEVLAVFDNRGHSLTLYSRNAESLGEAEKKLRGPLPARIAPSVWQEPVCSEPKGSFEDAVRATQKHIVAGDIIQAVISRRFTLPRIADPFDVYRGLRTVTPAPYLYFFNAGGIEIAGASPEVMIRVADAKVTVRPIAGTRPRGASHEEDVRLAEELLADPKECAEHIMLVDLARNDVGRVSVPGSVKWPQLMNIERYSHVMHIVSEVRAQLAINQYDAFDALRAAFPAGTLSGAPKVRAMQIIDELEPTRRGIYGGAVGYFGPNGNADFGIAIRTLVAHPDRMVIQAGAGIVADSDPTREREETEHKARAVIRAVQFAVSQDATWS